MKNNNNTKTTTTKTTKKYDIKSYYTAPDKPITNGVMSADNVNYQFFRDNILCKEKTDLESFIYNYLTKELKISKSKIIWRKGCYLIVKGKEPVALVAHLDTVHDFAPAPDTICLSTGGIIMSPYGVGGDDRCGVYSILRILTKGYRPTVMFTEDEEIGCVGAGKITDDLNRKFLKRLDVNYIIQLDRRGSKDCVFYDCDNGDFIDYVETFGFKFNWGTCSDISTLAPYFGIAGVNLSTQYYNEHKYHTYIDFISLERLVDVVIEMIENSRSLTEPFKYIEYTPKYSKYSGLYSYGYDDDYYYDNDDLDTKDDSLSDEEKELLHEDFDLEDEDKYEVLYEGSATINKCYGRKYKDGEVIKTYECPNCGEEVPDTDTYYDKDGRHCPYCSCELLKCDEIDTYICGKKDY